MASASFEADRSFEGGDSFGLISFQDASFTAAPDRIWCVDFDGRQFCAATTFDGCHFIGAPRFFEVKFHEDVSFRATEFRRSSARNIRQLFRPSLNAWNKDLQQYENAYRSLKMRMAEIGAPRDERRFLALELRARRLRFDSEVRPIESTISALYDLTSDYGESIWRPLVATATVVVLATLVYYWSTPPEVHWVLSIEFAIRQVFKPFNVWAENGAEILTSKTASVEVALPLKAMASFQSLVCLTLLFLAALAVRRRFRLT